MTVCISTFKDVLFILVIGHLNTVHLDVSNSWENCTCVHYEQFSYILFFCKHFFFVTELLVHYICECAKAEFALCWLHSILVNQQSCLNDS